VLQARHTWRKVASWRSGESVIRAVRAALDVTACSVLGVTAMTLTRWLRCALVVTSLIVAPVASAQASPPNGTAPPPSADSTAAPAPPPAYGSPPLPGLAYGVPPSGYVQPPAATPGTGAEALEYNDGDGVPHGYHLDYRARKGLVIAGGVTFGVSYLGTLALGAGMKSPPLFLPVVGPLLQAALIGLDDREHTEANFDDIAVTFLVVDGVVQAAGATLLLAGIAYPKKVLVPDVLQASALRVAPWRPNGDGIGLVAAWQL
jgi:hypothetical protein